MNQKPQFPLGETKLGKGNFKGNDFEGKKVWFVGERRAKAKAKGKE